MHARPYTVNCYQRLRCADSRYRSPVTRGEIPVMVAKRLRLARQMVTLLRSPNSIIFKHRMCMKKYESSTRCSFIGSQEVQGPIVRLPSPWLRLPSLCRTYLAHGVTYQKRRSDEEAHYPSGYLIPPTNFTQTTLALMVPVDMCCAGGFSM